MIALSIRCACGTTEQVLVARGDKCGFLCDGCRRLFDVHADGTVVTRSPLRDVVVVARGSLPDISGRRGTLVGNDE